MGLLELYISELEQKNYRGFSDIYQQKHIEVNSNIVHTVATIDKLGLNACINTLLTENYRGFAVDICMSSIQTTVRLYFPNKYYIDLFNLEKTIIFRAKTAIKANTLLIDMYKKDSALAKSIAKWNILIKTLKYKNGNSFSGYQQIWREYCGQNGLGINYTVTNLLQDIDTKTLA